MKNFKDKQRVLDSSYATLASCITIIIDRDLHQGISIGDIWQVLNSGNVVDYLEKKFPYEAEMSGIRKEERPKINQQILFEAEAVRGNERRKYGIENNGLVYLLALTMNYLQMELRKFTHPERKLQRELVTDPDL